MAFDKTLQSLSALHGDDVVEISGGGLSIGKNPPRKDGLFAKGFRHEIYAPLSESDVRELENSIEKEFPADLRAFYRKANGLSLFCGSLSISGMRLDNRRNLDVRMPISLAYGNTIEIPESPAGSTESHKDQIRLGFYSSDGTEVAMRLDGSQQILLLPRHLTFPILYSWPSLAHFLQTETLRMTEEYIRCEGKISPIEVLDSPIPAQYVRH